MFHYTADEHYGHSNVIKYCNRPFSSVEEMNAKLIANHNEVVTDKDTTIHVGDFTLIKNKRRVQEIIDQLNGRHIFIKGSHDYWIPFKGSIQILDKTIDKQYVVACHYCMHTWARSHYNSWHVFGHSHGGLDHPGKCYDVGVDNNGFYPVSMTDLKKIMDKRPNNFNLVRNRRRK